MTYFVQAPGYAWRRLTVASDAGGERVVALEVAGTLRIQLDGHRADVMAVAHLDTEDPPEASRQYAQIDFDETGVALAEGLVPGSYQVTAAITTGAPGTTTSAISAVLATGTAVVSAGETTELVMQCVDLPDLQQGVRAHGTLIVSTDWAMTPEAMVLMPLEADLGGREARTLVRASAIFASSSPGIYTWEHPEVLPGSYRVMTQPYSHTQEIEILVDGRVEPAIEVGDPCDVVVRVVDAAGASLGDTAWVCWRGHRPDDPTDGQSSCVSTSAADGAGRFRAPQGWVELTVDAEGYGQSSVHVELAPGSNEHVLRTDRLCTLSIAAKDVGTPVLLAFDGVRVLSGGQRVRAMVSTRSRDGTLTLDLPGPGDYTVRFEPIPGYLDVPDESVHFSEPGVREIEVSLVRRH